MSYSLFLAVCTTTNLTLGTTFGGQAKESFRKFLFHGGIGSISGEYFKGYVQSLSSFGLNLGLGYKFSIGKKTKLKLIKLPKAKFLSYPIPSAIVEEWEKVMACPPKVVPSVKLVVVQTARKREYDT